MAQEVREYFRLFRREPLLDEILQKSPDTRATTSTGPQLASDGGIAHSPPDDRDPFEILDEPMAVVEALCPRWPARDAPLAGGDFRL